MAMPITLKLPRRDGLLSPYTLTGRAPVSAPPGPIKRRIGMAAVHVVADPLASVNPTLEVALDWDATLRYRHQSGRWAWRSPRRWTPLSAGWASTGARRRS